MEANIDVHSTGEQPSVRGDRPSALWAVRMLASELSVVGMDLVEVIPTAVGSADITALVGERVVREALMGIALRRERGTET
jgi:agmatinase